MTWTSFRIRPTAGRGPVVASALFSMGSQGVQEDGDFLVTQFPDGTDAAAVHGAIAAADGDAHVVTGVVAEQDWPASWRHQIGAHTLGAITIAPPWLASPADGERMVVIEPGMAFGTGEHATTRGVVRLMQRAVRHGDIVADLGAGSAVLAIAAARLGAARVVAIELDPDAIADAEANVDRNGVGAQVTVIEGDAGTLLPLIAPLRLVVANIVSSVLLDLLPGIAAALTADGQAILSGILLEERDAIRRALADGWRVQDEDVEDIWWSVLITRG